MDWTACRLQWPVGGTLDASGSAFFALFAARFSFRLLPAFLMLLLRTDSLATTTFSPRIELTRTSQGLPASAPAPRTPTVQATATIGWTTRPAGQGRHRGALGHGHHVIAVNRPPAAARPPAPDAVPHPRQRNAHLHRGNTSPGCGTSAFGGHPATGSPGDVLTLRPFTAVAPDSGRPVSTSQPRTARPRHAARSLAGRT